MTRRRNSVATGLLAASIAAAVLVIVGFTWNDASVLEAFVPVAFLSLLVSFVIALVIGLPAHAILSRLNFTSVFPYLVVGALTGLAPGLVLELGRISEGRSGPFHIFWSAVVGPAVFLAPIGIGAAAVFWFVSVRGDP